MAGEQGCAWVTVTTDIKYVAGCLVTLDGLRRTGSKHPYVVLVDPLDKEPSGAGSRHEGKSRLPREARRLLEQAGCVLREVGFLEAGKKPYQGPDIRFADVWTKLRALEMYEYERIVLIDCDTVVRQNMDELFDLDLPDGWIAASHACTCNPRKIASYPEHWKPANCGFTYYQRPPADAPLSQLSTPFQPRPESVGTLHLLNSGLVVLRPDRATAARTVDEILHDPEVAGMRFPDQDLLARDFLGRVKFLPYEYNALRTLRTCHEPIWDDARVKMVHFILPDKPWLARPEHGDEFEVVNSWWWDAFDRVEAEHGKLDGWSLVVDAVPGKHAAK